MEVFDRVNRKVPAWLVMVGDGPDRPAAEELCREKGLSRSATFLGNMPFLEAVVPAADLYLLPSDSESFGLSALEAQACGVPVLGYDVGGLPEVVEKGVTGFLRPVGDVDGLTDEAVRLLSNPAHYAAASKASSERAVRLFDADSIVGRYLSLYEQVLAH